MGAVLHLEPPALSAGNQFDLSLFVTTTEKITGLDYGFNLSGAALVGRSLDGSAFPDAIDPSLIGDLGASVADVSSGLLAGEYLVAKYHFRVDGFANQAIVNPAKYPGTIGWVGAAPTFPEFAFTGFRSATVQFPEPTTFGLGLMLLGVWLAGKRRMK